MKEPGSRKSLEKLELGCLIGLILALLLFHGLTIRIPSLFIDEVEELAVAHGGFWDAVFQPDSMPPAFTTLLRIWVRFLSDDEQARWFSVLCHAASVFMAWWFTRRICSGRIAMLTAMVLAWNPLAIFYGQLIRGYSLYLLLATMLIGLWLVANRTNRLRDWISFSLVLCLGAYVHYYFVMIPWSMLFVQLAWETKQSLKSFLIASSVAAIGSLPIVSFLGADFVYQHDLREPRALSFGAIIYTFLSLVSGYSLGPSQRELQVLGARDAVIMQSWPILGMIVLSMGAIVILAVPGLRRFHLIRRIVPLMIIPVISIGLIGAFTGITYHVRFVVWLIYPFSLILGVLAESSKNWNWKLAVMILIFILFSLANYNRLFEDRYKIEDMRSTAKFLRENAGLDDRIYIISDYMVVPLSHYISGSFPVETLPIAGSKSKVLREEIEAERLIESIKKEVSSRVWLVYSREFHGDPKGLMWNALVENGARQQVQFAGVRILRWDKTHRN
jgi:hypothetical protein